MLMIVMNYTYTVITITETPSRTPRQKVYTVKKNGKLLIVLFIVGTFIMIMIMDIVLAGI